MDSTASVGRGPYQHSQRRSWAFEEERALIQGLKDLVARGMKADNGFCSGYTLILEQYMQQQFPGTTIRAEPHISSKVMVDIFGKDRATGEGAEGFADALQEVLCNTGEDAPAQNVRRGGVGGDFESNENDTESSAQGVESSASGKGRRVGKRKHVKDMEVEVVGLLFTLCEKADQRWGQMVERIGVQHDAKEQRKVLYEALKNIPMLTTEQKFIVTKYFCRNQEEMYIFFSVDEEEKASMVKMILENKL
ncbi:Unknown protein [Striga hermonthica]|uniref:Uncharacterized protein n=1 Tax=Striga hermonthica TaxID=68872 RepID=A0A9N7R3F6_STRHE|nr:Unknown protein [Striga hermonthica]